MARGTKRFEIGMTLTSFGTGCPGTLVEMDPDFIPPKWVKVEDNQSGETHLITKEDYDFEEMMDEHLMSLY